MTLIAVLVTFVLALYTFTGAITLTAVVIFALPCVVLTVVAAVRFRSQLVGGLTAVFLTALASSEVVNLLSGSDYGPAARSSFLSSAGSGALVVLAASQWPGLLLLPVAAMISGALALGAAQEVRGPATAAGAAACLTLASVERGRRRAIGLPRDLLATILPLLLAAVAGVLMITVQKDNYPTDPYLPFPASVHAEIHPPGQAAPRPSPTPTENPTESPTPSPSPSVSASPATDGASSGLHVNVVHALLWTLLVLLIPPLLWLLARARSVLSWRRAARRLRTGDPGEAVTGAWVWASARRASLGDGFDPWQSPDVLLASGALRDDPLWSELATVVSRAAFAGVQTPPEARAPAWAAAGSAWEASRAASPWWRRLWSDLGSARRLKRSRPSARRER